jgi:imidazolonepropionase-like amidohydrolase
MERGMKRMVLAMALASSACMAGEALPQQPGDLVIANVTVVSPERLSPLQHGFVRIRDGRIAEVSDRPLGGVRTIDGTGRFLVPGLIDSHVHLQQLPMQPGQRAAHARMAAAALAQEPRSYLFHGFTTVIDPANTADAVARWNRMDVRPDAWFCGAAPIANGYPMNFAPEGLRFSLMPYFLDDERRKDGIPRDIDTASHTPERVVARMRADGAICAKTYYETGFGRQRDLPTPDRATVERLTAAARAAGMPVLVHANSLEAQRFAVASGASVIAHGLWNGNAAPDGGLSTEATALLDTVVERGIGYQPTMQVLHGEIDLFDPGFLADSKLRDVLPSALIEWAASREGQWFRDEVGGNAGGADVLASSRPLLSRLDRVVGHLAQRGARLLFGSDTPSGPTYANPPGLNGWFEIQRWSAAGVEPSALFKALTSENARVFGLGSEVGSIEPGKRAHLLVLGRNPLESADAYDAIETVILAGLPIARSDLSARRP